jgi:GR25 family glycosyltransferase involved in LPS biosynthesis
MWGFFDSVYCMNLDKRQDRWEAVTKEFNRVGLIAERFKAIDEEHTGNRYLSYNYTYHGILSKAVGKTLVLEDDVIFKSLGHLEQALIELPQDWDVLYLGANLNGTKQERYSGNLFKIRNSLMTHGVAYSDKMRRHIVESFNPGEFPVYDEWLRINVQEQFKCFVVAPMVAWQRPGYSDLWQTHANYVSTLMDGEKLL